MPSALVTELIKEVAVLKSQVKDIMILLKWQMGLLAAVLAAIIGVWVGK